MKHPNPVNFITAQSVRSSGWQAEARDEAGHLTRTNAPFQSDGDIVWFVRESIDHGDTVTIWPLKPETAAP